MGGEKKNTTSLVSKDGVILFQGDSITDSGREKRQEIPNNSSSFGNGYALMIAANLLNKYSDKNLTIYNRGISGNKVYQLAERWQKDCLGLKPEVLSILIGVNDYWHKRNGQYDGTPEVYENDFRKLLTQTKEAYPVIKFVICQPFVLTGTTAVDETWLEPFKPYQDLAEKIAREFKAVWVPFQKVFTEATKHAPAKYWTADGVHPSMAGAQLMAEAWLKATGL
jgi:lysophospholipase L1-like esterase